MVNQVSDRRQVNQAKRYGTRRSASSSMPLGTHVGIQRPSRDNGRLVPERIPAPHHRDRQAHPHPPGYHRGVPPGPGPAPPVALAAGGPDPYAWMRDRDLPALRDYLAAERAWYDRWLESARGLRDELAAELAARLLPAEESVSWRRGGRSYFTRTVPGQDYEQFCRAAGPGEPAHILLDESLLLADSVDFDGDELYQLRIRDLARGSDLPERIEGTSYGLAWSADSRSLLYVVSDDRYRPCEVRRHVLGTDRGQDTLVFREEDQRFELTVRATRSGAYLLIETASRDSTETLVLPAAQTARQPAVIEKRSPGVEYRAEHARGPGPGEFFLVTNAEAEEFRLVSAPADAPGRARWRQVIAGSPDTRLVSCDVFGRYLVVEQRHAAATQLRIVDRRSGEQRLIEAGGPQVSLCLAANEDYEATVVTVRTESLVQPPSWHDVDLATGRWQERKRQPVPGHDPARYVTQRVTAAAPDGTPVPVTIAYRAGLRRDGSAPCLLYGYGAYESCEWPAFSVATPSLLDRGFVYAIAHVRGGGEGGRNWWLDGRLNRTRNTFTAFIAVADMLATRGWAAPDRIVSRGLSAGGLLQGAVYSMAPRRWRAVVAEVPFVDCVTTMLDPDIPLTVNEWDEWGDPRDPAARAYLASYSPYDNPPSGSRPDLLVTGSVHDPRVLIHEPAKWVARLRATDTVGSRLLFRAELGAGAHTGPAGRYDSLRYEAEVLAFIVDAVS